MDCVVKVAKWAITRYLKFKLQSKIINLASIKNNKPRELCTYFWGLVKINDYEDSSHSYELACFLVSIYI